jgi:hypothetical protein
MDISLRTEVQVAAFEGAITSQLQLSMGFAYREYLYMEHSTRYSIARCADHRQQRNRLSKKQQLAPPSYSRRNPPTSI